MAELPSGQIQQFILHHLPCAASNKLEQCPDFKSEMSGDGVVDDDYEHVHALVAAHDGARAIFFILQVPLASDPFGRRREKTSRGKRNGEVTRGRQIEDTKRRDN